MDSPSKNSSTVSSQGSQESQKTTATSGENASGFVSNEQSADTKEDQIDSDPTGQEGEIQSDSPEEDNDVLGSHTSSDEEEEIEEQSSDEIQAWLDGERLEQEDLKRGIRNLEFWECLDQQRQDWEADNPPDSDNDFDEDELCGGDYP